MATTTENNETLSTPDMNEVGGGGVSNALNTGGSRGRAPKVVRIGQHSSQGARMHMEDYMAVTNIQDPPFLELNSPGSGNLNTSESDLDLGIGYTFVGIFDGHGGASAARQAKIHLEGYITSHKDFDSEDDQLVLKAIKDGYAKLQRDMLRQRDKWPKSPTGLPSNCGTTATIVFIKNGKLYIGHVGDSALVLGFQDPTTSGSSSKLWKAKQVTTDHKPDCPREIKRIRRAGGRIVNRHGVHRIVYELPVIAKAAHGGMLTRSTPKKPIPFLNVARSLGDFWSYNPAKEEYIVSPVPDTTVIKLERGTHHCLILGSDGLWNALSPELAVNIVYSVEKNGARRRRCGAKDTGGLDAAKRLVKRAIDNWAVNEVRADNTSAIVVVFE